MDFKEYYNLPEGANAKFTFMPSYFDTVEENYPCPPSMERAFQYYGGNSIPNLDVSNVTNMRYMFYTCPSFKSLNLSNWDTSNVTTMEYMFYSCTNLVSVDMNNWDTSKVTSVNNMFNGCSSIRSIAAMDCSKVTTKNYYPLYNYSNYTYLTDLGGFIGMKTSWDNTYGLNKCPNLTYESCINVLNGLHDFTGNGETPTSTQGVLKVHANFLTTVGDAISIGTNKGWTITA